MREGHDPLNGCQTQLDKVVAEAADATCQSVCSRQAFFEAVGRDLGTVRVLHPNETCEIVRHGAVEVVGESWHGPRHASLLVTVLSGADTGYDI